MGVVDMGGGSVEVTFVPSDLGANPDNLTFRNVTFNGDDLNVYGYSYLYYGHNEARKQVQEIVVATSGSDGTYKKISIMQKNINI